MGAEEVSRNGGDEGVGETADLLKLNLDEDGAN
jgi:hypothetical protein